jgi:uncharacterized protein (TIGR03086 family)
MTIHEYAEADRRLSMILDALPASAWSEPSGCEGWTARDVLQHVIVTQRDFLTERGVGIGDAAVMEEPLLAWRGHADAVMDRLSDDAVSSREFAGFFGPTTIGETIDRFYVWDMVVHRWDIAQAAGLDAPFTTAELDRIEAGADSFGDALYMEGICGPPIVPPVEASRSTQVLGRLGRAVPPGRETAR